MPAKYLTIVLGQHEPWPLHFKIKNTPIAQLWAERMQQRYHWPMDHPDRFYGFDSKDQEQQRAVEYVQHCIRTINDFEPLIEQEFEYTQDHLNYLHHIFEVHHGLLDQQTGELWQRAPVPVRRALAELNLAVHRCEAAMAQPRPRFVCTWFGMPKTHRLDPGLQGAYGTWKIEFGTVYLNYCEIGKTVEDLFNDNDQYIADEAFRPFSHYSADFNVQFYNRNLSEIYGRMQRYIDQHRNFFVAQGITSVYNIKAQPLRYPVAELIYNGNQERILEEIAQRQWVQQVIIE